VPSHTASPHRLLQTSLSDRRRPRAITNSVGALLRRRAVISSLARRTSGAMAPRSILEAFTCLDWLGAMCQLPAKSADAKRGIRCNDPDGAAQPRGKHHTKALAGVVGENVIRETAPAVEQSCAGRRRVEASDICGFYGICTLPSTREACGEVTSDTISAGVCETGMGIPPMLGQRLGSGVRNCFQVVLVDINEAASRDERLRDVLARLRSSPTCARPLGGAGPIACRLAEHTTG